MKHFKLYYALAIPMLMLGACNSNNGPDSISKPESESSISGGESVSSSSQTPVDIYYTITFIYKHNGSEKHDEQTVKEGEKPISPVGANFENEDAREGYVYTLLGWEASDGQVYAIDELPEATKDETYTIKFDESPVTYSVKFFSEDGSQLLKEAQLEYGDIPTAPKAPEKEGEAGKYSYVFAGWTTSIGGTTVYKNNALPEVVEAANYYAAYRQEAQKYALRFVCKAGETDLGTINSDIYYGDDYKINAPEIEGYIAMTQYVKGNCEGDVEVNVQYTICDVATASTKASKSISGEGSEDSPYLISSAADWMYVVSNSNAYIPEIEGISEEKAAKGTYIPDTYYKLTTSLDLRALKDSAKIGEMHANFDGNNFMVAYTIENGAGQTGLIGNVAATGSVKNLSTTGSHTSKGTYAGGVCGKVFGKVSNLTNWATVRNSTNGAGGVIASLSRKDSECVNCVNYGDVTGTVPQATAKIGGILAIVEAVTFDDSQIYSGKVENCVNYGEIRGFNGVGGIAGELQHSIGGVITHCNNYGLVHANEETATVEAKLTRTAGIAGICNNLIEYCTNYGEVFMDGVNTECWCGGIAGAMTNIGQVDHCVNEGYIHSNTACAYLGGVVGATGTNADSTISNCTNNGDVYAPNFKYVGGIIGGTLSGSKTVVIYSCTNNGTITGNTTCGGIAGMVYEKFYDETTWTGNVNNGTVVCNETKADLYNLI